MDDFSANECRGLAEVIREIIRLMQMIDRRTVLPPVKFPPGKFTARKTRRAAKPKAKASKTMVCPAPMKAEAKPKRKAAHRMPKATRSPSAKSKGYINNAGDCVCPMPARATPSHSSMAARKTPSHSSMAAKTKRPTRRRAAAKKTDKQVTSMKQRKKTVRRQNRKRPVMTKRLPRGNSNVCP